MKWTEQQLRDYEARTIAAARKRAGARPVVQEPKEDLRQEVNNAEAGGGSHEGGNGRFRVTVNLLVSDKRDRDADGAVSTLFDCLLDAAGRLTGMDRRNLRKMAKRIEREGRR